MDSQAILYNKIGDDENYTPDYGVIPILEYIPNGSIVWCPFDTEHSEFVKQISKLPDIKVIATHIKFKGKLMALQWCSKYIMSIDDFEFQRLYFNPLLLGTNNIGNGKDFFTYEPDNWDIIISNPPFQNKRQFFERALSFNKPFALIMTNAAFNDKYPIWSFEEAGKQFQCLKFDKRIHFIKPDGTIQKKTTFGSSYFCYNFLPRDFIQEKINF